MKRILVLGGGFSGLWSAIGAARKLREEGVSSEEAEVVLIDAREVHSIRVRNYELENLDDTVIPFAEVLDPVGVRWIQAEVEHIDSAQQVVQFKKASDGKSLSLSYDRLVMALGSKLIQPPIKGLKEYAFDIDTYEGSLRLKNHLIQLSEQEDSPARYSVIVIGAGLTGVEVATELPAYLKSLVGDASKVNVMLLDRAPQVADQMGEAQPVIAEAAAALGVTARPGVDVAEVGPHGVELSTGEKLAASTVIWCGGFRANALTADFPVALDSLGRLPVDEFMQVKGGSNVFAAGDCAVAIIDGTNPSIMSCQHGRPMGRFAGHNVAADLLGKPMLPLLIEWYITCVDLGSWGAVYTEGRDRVLATQGEAAKKTKQTINQHRIYPPRTGNADEIFAAAAPVIDQAPKK